VKVGAQHWRMISVANAVTVFLNINAQDKDTECTALMVAAMNGRDSVVATLCAHGAMLSMNSTSPFAYVVDTLLISRRQM
jgi:anti-sigma-K factor RskA